MARQLTLAATGDALITRRLPYGGDPAFASLVELIRGCDVAFTNTEITLGGFECPPMFDDTFAIMADPALAHELRAVGFNCTAFANNHSLNFGAEGVRRTVAALRAAGLVCAGTGEHLGEARLPAYLETPGGRVGLVACASSFALGQHAGERTSLSPGRPGLNPLRVRSTYRVSPRHLDALREIADATGLAAAREHRAWLGWSAPVEAGKLSFLGRTFEATDGAAGIRTEPDPRDLAEIARWTAEAKRQAGFAIVSIHAHEAGRHHWEPADFLPTFARAVVDAGADVVIGHGPHMLRGLELYRGKPIFYSLGNFISQHETVERVGPDDAANLGAAAGATPGEVVAGMHAGGTRSFPSDERYWESVLPVCAFEGDRLVSMELHPLSLGFGRPVWERGTPRLAEREAGSRTLQRFAELSAPFGARVDVTDGVGRLRLDG